MKVLGSHINIWNGSFSSLDDNDCIKFELRNESGINFKCLLFVQLPSKTPYELKEKLLRILRQHGLAHRHDSAPIAMENLLQIQPEIVEPESAVYLLESDYDKVPYEEENEPIYAIIPARPAPIITHKIMPARAAPKKPDCSPSLSTIRIVQNEE